MKTNSAVSAQHLLDHFLQQEWSHYWGYIVLFGVADIVVGEIVRGSRRRRNWR